MGRFNFTNITLNSKADITQVMNNFNQIDELGITAAEVNTLIDDAKSTVNQETNTKLNAYTKTADLGNLALKGYSYGTANPSGGSNGDIYDQYF